jgi:hypothetical protein
MTPDVAKPYPMGVAEGEFPPPDASAGGNRGEWSDVVSARGPSAHPPPDPSVGADLRSVLPVASEDLGGGFRVVSVECYELGLIVRWLVAPPVNDWSPFPPVTVADDVGTHYLPGSGGSFGHASALRGDAMFRPAPPPEASILTVTHGDASVAISLAR